MSAEFEYIGDTEMTLVQRTGDQYATGSSRLKPLQVSAVAHAAGGEKPLLGKSVDIGAELRKVRPAIATDASQIHQYDVGGPVCGLRIEAGRVTQAVGGAIDREDETFTLDARPVVPRFGPNDRYDRETCGEGAQACIVAKAGVEPNGQARKGSQDRSHQSGVVAAIENGVEIGKVEHAQLQGFGQASYQRQDLSLVAQWTLQALVAFALAEPGADSGTVEQVNDRD